MYVILEYMPTGDLKTVLRKSRAVGNGDYGNLVPGSKSLGPAQLITFAREVANGMAFLTEQKVKSENIYDSNIIIF